MSFALKRRRVQKHTNSMSGMFTELKKLDDEKTRSDGPATPPPVAKRKPSTSTPPLTGASPVGPQRARRLRQSFDVYEDQYQALRRLATEELAQGNTGSMSEMVRQAIDRYLEARKRGEL